MANPFLQSLESNFEEALRLLEAALRDCPDHMWEVDLWADEAPTRPVEGGGLEGSAPWFLGYHALTVLDYDLTAEFAPWEPPAPFDDNTWSMPNRVFTQPELLGYVDYCRSRVGSTLESLTEESAARTVPPRHRYAGQVYGVLVGGLPLHLVEHASQIRQYLTAAGVKVRAMPGDHNYEG